MFKSDELIYIQMQKTGCTHIASLLKRFFDGQQIGKHNAATEEQIASHNYFISSIRNPWDWYLSLWTYGVQGNGALMERLTNRQILHTVKTSLNYPKVALPSLMRELSKDVSLWRSVYETDDIMLFRKWIKMIHDSNNKYFLGEGYGHSAVTDFCGFMTHRYLYLCCRNSRELENTRSLSNYSDLVQFDHKNCYINFFIRQESLEDDLCKAIEKVRDISQEERDMIYKAKKTNTSKRSLSISDYYDQESIDIIYLHDRLLIEKFSYSPPIPR